jgi:hypothetical protein
MSIAVQILFGCILLGVSPFMVGLASKAIGSPDHEGLFLYFAGSIMGGIGVILLFGAAT